MKWQSQLFYCQFLLLPYLDVTPVSQQRASPIRAGPLCTKRHTFWLMAFLVDRNQICVSKCHKQISEIFQKNNGHYGAILLHKTSPFPDARITIALMLLEQYSKLFAESDQGDFRTIGGAKYCLSAKITFRILRITAYTIVCR